MTDRSPCRWTRGVAGALVALGLLAGALALVLDPGFVVRHLSHDGKLGEATIRWLAVYRRVAAAAAVGLLAAALLVHLRRASLEPRLARWVPRLLLAGGGLLVALPVAELAVRLAGTHPGWDRTRAYEAHVREFWRGIRPQIGEGGLRGRPLEQLPLPGVRRVLVLGDSFVFGFGIQPLHDTFPAALERELEQALGPGAVAVLNGGRPGADTLEETELARELLPRTAPDLVVLGYFLNDIESRAAKERFFSRRRLLPLVSDNLVRHSRLCRLLDRHLVSLLRGDLPGYTEHLGELHALEHERHRAELARLVETVRGAGVPLAVVVFPVVRDFAAYPLTAVHERLLATFGALGVPVLDLLPAFAGEDAQALVVTPQDRHLNARGLALAAAATAPFLLAEGLLPP